MFDNQAFTPDSRQRRETPFEVWKSAGFVDQGGGHLSLATNAHFPPLLTDPVILTQVTFALGAVIRLLRSVN